MLSFRFYSAYIPIQRSQKSRKQPWPPRRSAMAVIPSGRSSTHLSSGCFDHFVSRSLRKKGFGRDHFANGPQEALRCLFFLCSALASSAGRFFRILPVRSESGVHEKKCQPDGLTRICLVVLYLRSNALILLRISARNAAAAATAMPANSVPCCAGTPVLP